MKTSGSRIATLRLIGGRPAIDLVNTISWRGDPSHTQDHLGTGEHCLVWIERVGLLTPLALDRLRRRCDGDAEQGQVLLASLRGVRAAICQHLVDPAQPHLGALGALVGETLGACELVEVDGGARWMPPDDVLAPSRLVVLDLLDHLQRPRGPLGTCEDPACAWAFVDVSRARTRRWCSAAECGNRDRARRHYHRGASAPHSPGQASP